MLQDVHVCFIQSWNFLLSHRNLRLQKQVAAIHLEKLVQKCDLGFCTPNKVNMLNHRYPGKLHLNLKELHLNSFRTGFIYLLLHLAELTSPHLQCNAQILEKDVD